MKRALFTRNVVVQAREIGTMPTPVESDHFIDSRLLVPPILNLFPEVVCDRLVRSKGEMMIYGWIDREQDEYKDFIILEFDIDGVRQMTTSSAKYSKEFATRLGWENDHDDCERAEDYFDNVKCVKLSDSNRKGK